LVRLEDGACLSFAGRADDQVKLRGYRVQLREIETALRPITGSDLVAVVPVYDMNGLCEDVVAFYAGSERSEARLRSECKERLPDYMIPKRIVKLGSLPLNDSGKTDYRALRLEAAKLCSS
jgi:surfactin family lipopeptide synthetase B